MTKSARRSTVDGLPPTAPPSPDLTDPAVAHALAWVSRGMPEGEIVYDDDAPKLTQEQLAEFEPAAIRIASQEKKAG